jgi:hypothetical protein
MQNYPSGLLNKHKATLRKQFMLHFMLTVESNIYRIRSRKCIDPKDKIYFEEEMLFVAHKYTDQAIVKHEE